MFIKRFISIMALLGLVLLASCSEGLNDSTSVTSNSESFASGALALSVAERVTVVDAKGALGESASASSAEAGEQKFTAELAPYDVPGGTPYYTDITRVWVSERSAEVFDSVNSILCFLSSLQYEAMMNRGDYVAQLDMSRCEDQTDASGRLNEGGSSSSSTHPNYTRWVINSSRADSSSPHIVKAWVEMNDEFGQPAGLIFVLVTITEAKSESNPLGIFRLDYGGHMYLPDGTLDTSTWSMRGFIETRRDPVTDEVLLYYATDEEHNANEIRRSKAVLNRDEVLGTGEGSVYAYAENPGEPVEEDNFDFYYNDTHFLRGIYNTSTTLYDDSSCYSRYFFDEVAHKYGLYNSTGQRVEHNSGMPLLYNDGIDDYYGWISYYGLWFPDQVSITNGTPVQGVDFDTAGNLVLTPYEVFTSGGRLIKYTRGTVTLGEIRNVPMNWGGELYTGAGFNNYIAIWNGSSAQFEATAIVDYDAGTTLPIAYAPIDLTNYDNITFWSDSLGGYVRVDLMAPTGGTITPDNSTTAITYNVEVVYPGTEDPALGTNGLLCFENCPNATPDVLNSASPMYPASTDWSLSYQMDVLTSPPGVVNAITYSFDTARMQLVDDTSALDVVLDEPSPVTGGSLGTGPMIINTPANIASLECSTGSPHLCAWKLWDNTPTFYVWETGPDTWSRLSALRYPATSNFVQFDPPIKVEYTHNDPESQYFGSKFFLEYGGFGDLWGIPGECVDPETGETTACGENSWWTPSFSVPTGTELINVETDEPYLAKALEKEQKMKKTSTNLPCDTFTLMHYTLPDITQWEEPLIGPMPDVTAPPKVIDGELQGR